MSSPSEPTPPSPPPPLDFEAALRHLEQVVDDLERGEPELSAALTKYEQGIRLLAECQGVLERAERSVALLTGVDAAGHPLTTPFDSTATADREPTPVAPASTVAPAARVPTPRKRRTPPAEPDDRLIPF